VSSFGHRVWSAYADRHLIGADFTGKGYAAREKVFNAYRDYLKEMPEDCAFIIRERQRVIREAGVNEHDMYTTEASFSFAAFPNTAPTLYWSIYDMFARPELLEEVRDEILREAVSAANGVMQLDVAALKTKCPLLLGTVQEVQRRRHAHANIRKVIKDTVLDGKYLLKQGNYMQVPGQPIHHDPRLWGSSADTFDPHRFLQTDHGRSTGSFMAWGAAPHMCPARQFATTEVMILTALLAVRYDLVLVEDGREKKAGEWDLNPTVSRGETNTLGTPKTDVLVEVRQRKEGMGKWTLKMGESKTRVPLASG
jgi:cytochrome P450